MTPYSCNKIIAHTKGKTVYAEWGLYIKEAALGGLLLHGKTSVSWGACPVTVVSIECLRSICNRSYHHQKSTARERNRHSICRGGKNLPRRMPALTAPDR